MIFKRTIKKGIICVILAALLLSLTIRGFPQSQSHNLRSVTVQVSLDFVRTDDGKLFTFKDSLGIVYYEDIVLYRIPTPYEVSKILSDTSGNIISEELVDEGVKYQYLIHKRNSRIGFLYDSIKALHPRQVSIDSFVRKNMSYEEKMFYSGNDSLIEQSENSSPYDLVEKYIAKTRPDETYNDSTYLYYSSGLKDVNYSFSRSLDSIKNRKLSRVIMIYNPVPKGKYPFEVPRRVFLFEIRKSVIANQEEVTDLLKRFRQENYGLQ